MVYMYMENPLWRPQIRKPKEEYRSCHPPPYFRQSYSVSSRLIIFYHLPPGVLSVRKEEPRTEMFHRRRPVPCYSWPRRTQVADKIVSPSCVRSSLPPCPFSRCPLCHSFSPSAVVESCKVSRPLYCMLQLFVAGI